ncbi:MULTISPECIES: hypothetical protein [Sorangium]|uniref:Uncharacterized protein n=1 Tax=Sorangium cellulosum TaxID=56 RepID=A0A4V0NFA9_SORCE|nr:MULTISPECIES: hypothetical protein [Sorangium]AUX29032.1 hypothetical protein SOCE836_011170 [Sorangium cellulosum]WCQ88422.1 hypothetical protein NQZ70_01098 [Sorangium sp. Soce836]
MAAPIVVDIASGPAVHGELPALLIEACSRAAGGGGCALGDPKRTGTPVRALAVVWLEGPDHRRLRVDVASVGAAGGTLSSREIEFREEDPLPDRYRTAGLLVAALSSERAGAPVAGAPVDAASADAEQAAEAPPPRPLGWFIGAGGLAGNGLEGGPASAGGWAMALALDRRSGFFGTLSASYATTLREPAPGLSVQWLGLGVGGGIAAPVAPLDVLVRARILAAAEWVIASPSDPKKPEETGHGWTFGTRTAIDLAWPAEGSVALLGSAEAFVRIHQTDLRVHPKPKATLPSGGLTGMLGVQLRLR